MAITTTTMVNGEVLGIALAGPLARIKRDEAAHTAHLLAALEALGGAVD